MVKAETTMGVEQIRMSSSGVRTRTLSDLNHITESIERREEVPAPLRLESVDVLRGLVMILMALDHTRDFFGITGFSPTDPVRTTVWLFFTRWITHFCAPVFFLLTGTGAFLSLGKKSKRELSRFLITRGACLILLELTLFRCLGFQFNFDYRVTLLNVLWALGWAMILLSVTVHLSSRANLLIGVTMVTGHNLLDRIQSANPLWSLLHAPNFIINTGRHAVFAAYPLIPWIGVAAIGYGLGQVFSWTPERRKRLLLGTGLAVFAAFVVIRAINVYGDPVPWTTQRSAVFTLLSFLNTNKYPPSLLFLLMTLGPTLLLLGAIDRGAPRFLRPSLVFGRVPLFYYLLHMPVIHVIAVFVCLARYGQVRWMFESPTIAQFPVTVPPGWGFSLPVIYFIWILVVTALYPVCRWFANLKRRRSDEWLSYL